MNRRDMLKTLPAAALGLALPGSLRSEESPYNRGYTASLACGYNTKVAEMLVRIRETQMENLMAAAFTAARTISRGGTWGILWKGTCLAAATACPPFLPSGTIPAARRKETCCSPIFMAATVRI